MSAPSSPMQQMPPTIAKPVRYGWLPCLCCMRWTQRERFEQIVTSQKKLLESKQSSGGCFQTVKSKATNATVNEAHLMVEQRIGSTNEVGATCSRKSSSASDTSPRTSRSSSTAGTAAQYVVMNGTAAKIAAVTMHSMQRHVRNIMWSFYLRLAKSLEKWTELGPILNRLINVIKTF